MWNALGLTVANVLLLINYYLKFSWTCWFISFLVHIIFTIILVRATLRRVDQTPRQVRLPLVNDALPWFPGVRQQTSLKHYEDCLGKTSIPDECEDLPSTAGIYNCLLTFHLSNKPRVHGGYRNITLPTHKNLKRRTGSSIYLLMDGIENQNV